MSRGFTGGKELLHLRKLIPCGVAQIPVHKAHYLGWIQLVLTEQLPVISSKCATGTELLTHFRTRIECQQLRPRGNSS